MPRSRSTILQGDGGRRVLYASGFVELRTLLGVRDSSQPLNWTAFSWAWARAASKVMADTMNNLS
jgi:hypothetical protein